MSKSDHIRTQDHLVNKGLGYNGVAIPGMAYISGELRWQQRAGRVARFLDRLVG